MVQCILHIHFIALIDCMKRLINKATEKHIIINNYDDADKFDIHCGEFMKNVK